MKNKIITLALLSVVLGGCGSNDSTSNLNTNAPKTSNPSTPDTTPGSTGNMTVEPWQKLISLSDNSACAVTQQGALKCWGEDNSNGILGTGDTAGSLVPVATLLTRGVKSIATGSVSACANVNGGVQCWGSNSNGQLGDDGQTEIGDGKISASPVAVKGLEAKVTSIASGGKFNCAVVNGGAKCWGKNEFGTLGNGSNTDSAVPVDVQGLTSGVTIIAAGPGHACALMDGDAYCWGSDEDGRVRGDGTVQNPVATTTPVKVELAAKATHIAIGAFHTCATLETGRIQCWGSNTNGKLGNSTDVIQHKKPSLVSDITGGATFATLSNGTSCALVNDTLFCWGFGGYGALGKGVLENTAIPGEATFAQGLNIQDVATYNGATCVLTKDYQLSCWGNNERGQLGSGTNADALEKRFDVKTF